MLDRFGEEEAIHVGVEEPPRSGFEFFLPGDERPLLTSHPSRGCLAETLHATSGDHVLVTDSRAGRLYTMDPSGTLTELYESGHRAEVEPAYVERMEGLIESFESEHGQATAESKRVVRDRVGDVGDPLPAVWSALVPDVEGGVWLERAICLAGEDSERPRVWEVVGGDGRLEGTVRVPGHLRIISVRGNRVLASFRDDLGIPYLTMYEVQR
jgi:hypothetical protein